MKTKLLLRQFRQRLRDGRDCSFLGARSGNHNHADQHEQRSENRSGTNAFAPEELADDHGNDGIDVCVGANFGWRLVMKKPHVRGKTYDGAGDDQVC